MINVQWKMMIEESENVQFRKTSLMNAVPTSAGRAEIFEGTTCGDER